MQRESGSKLYLPVWCVASGPLVAEASRRSGLTTSTDSECLRTSSSTTSGGPLFGDRALAQSHYGVSVQDRRQRQRPLSGEGGRRSIGHAGPQLRMTSVLFAAQPARSRA